MTNINKTQNVRRGDCAWKVAARNLQANGKKISNNDIINEMKRLAKLNGCKDVDDFNKKFFSTAGKKYVTDKAEKTQSQKKAEEKPLSARKTETRHVKKAASTQQAQKIDTTKTKKTLQVKSPQQAYADKINNMPNDTARIIEHNKTSYQGQYYGIVDKKSCQLKIYDKQGNVVKTITVGVGKKKGDNLQSYYMEHAEKTKNAWKAEQGRYTTAGEFTLDDHKKAPIAYTGSDGKPRLMNLKGDNHGVRGGQLSIHMIYDPKTSLEKSHQSTDYKRREAAIKSKGLEDNRMSYGCVNLTEADYDIMHQYLGEGDKIYILPEETGNKLQLEKQKDGSYKFEQTYHKSDERGLAKEQASIVNYDVRPNKNPVYLAQKEIAHKAAESKQLAQAKSAEEKQETHWYNPRTWFS